MLLISFLIAQSLRHLADLRSEPPFNSELFCRSLHLSSWYSVNVRFLKNLYQCHFTAFVSIQEEWNIPMLAHFRIHKINRPKADIQTYGTVTVTIARSSVRTFALIGIQLNGNLSFHHLFAEPFQHAEHRITPPHTQDKSSGRFSMTAFANHPPAYAGQMHPAICGQVPIHT